MSKAETVSAQKAAIISGQDQALEAGLEAVWDQSAMEQKASDGTLTQGDLDAAIKAATDPLNAQVAALTAQDAADIQAGKDALAALQTQFDALAAKEGVEAGVLTNLQSAKDQLAAVLASLNNIPTSVSAP